MELLMVAKMRPSREKPWTFLALVWLEATVGQDVVLEFVGSVELLRAPRMIFERALETLERNVSEIMALQLVPPVERLAAYRALVRLLAGMHEHVDLEVVFRFEALGAHLALVYRDGAMHQQMSPEISLAREDFGTTSTGVAVRSCGDVMLESRRRRVLVHALHAPIVSVG